MDDPTTDSAARIRKAMEWHIPAHHDNDCPGCDVCSALDALSSLEAELAEATRIANSAFGKAEQYREAAVVAEQLQREAEAELAEARVDTEVAEREAEIWAERAEQAEAALVHLGLFATERGDEFWRDEIQRVVDAIVQTRALAAATGEAETERDEMVCDRCGRRHDVVWFAPSDLWNDVMREGDRGNPDKFSFCCPTCFMQLADERGVGAGMWVVAADPGGGPYPTMVSLFGKAETDGG